MAKAKLKILYGEGDEDVLKAQAAEFEKAGHSVQAALGRKRVDEELKKSAFDLVMLGSTLTRNDRHHLPYMAKKANAETKVLVMHADGTGAILGPDAAAMGFDDLLRNRQAEAGILAKALVRAVGVKAFEDFLQRVLADAGAVIIDNDLDFGAHASADDADLAAGVGE